MDTEIMKTQLNTNSEQATDSLQAELGNIRRASLAALRRGDYMKMARLTAQAARINRALLDLQGLSLPRESI